MPEKHKRKHLTSFQMIILGFAGVILLGALLLMLPVSSAERVVTPFDQALFTSTSAVCVTGLVVQDTGSYWSGFGQAVILLLIQTGGLGVVTVAVSVFMLSGRKISLMQRSTMQDAISAPKVGGIVRLTKFILRGTFLIEGIGAVLLLPVFCRDFGIKGIWMSIFHSISAFCNAGFDILGTADNTFVSLSGYAGNFWLNIVIMLLIIIGGIGFLTWDDVYTNKRRFKRYRMQSKIILLTTAILIFVPAIFFFVCDFGQVSIGKRTLLSLFQSVTTRTAGFNTADLSSMTEAGQAIMILLMLIGKHKMAPVLSPKKSIEGAVGGVVGAAALGAIYAAVTHGPVVEYAVICAVGALISMVGDLAASAIKRNRGIKDYGKLIPGHGGILDRFDSVIFTSPIIFYLAKMLLGL